MSTLAAVLAAFVILALLAEFVRPYPHVFDVVVAIVLILLLLGLA